MVDAPPSNLNLIEKFTVGIGRRSLSFNLVPSELKRNLFCSVSVQSLKFCVLVTDGSIRVSRFGKPDVTEPFIEASDLISCNFGRSDRSIILKVRVKILILPIFRHAFDEQIALFIRVIRLSCSTLDCLKRLRKILFSGFRIEFGEIGIVAQQPELMAFKFKIL